MEVADQRPAIERPTVRVIDYQLSHVSDAKSDYRLITTVLNRFKYTVPGKAFNQLLDPLRQNAYALSEHTIMAVSSNDSITSAYDAELKARLTAVLRKFPEIKAAYLFGSRASGRARGDSDIDVALVTRDRFGKKKLDAMAALVKAGLEQVDLVILDDDDLVMRHEAVRSNRLLFARPEFDHGAYFSKTIREYEDLEPLLAHQRRAYKQCVEHGSS